MKLTIAPMKLMIALAVLAVAAAPATAQEAKLLARGAWTCTVSGEGDAPDGDIVQTFAADGKWTGETRMEFAAPGRKVELYLMGHGAWRMDGTKQLQIIHAARGDQVRRVTINGEPAPDGILQSARDNAAAMPEIIDHAQLLELTASRLVHKVDAVTTTCQRASSGAAF